MTSFLSLFSAIGISKATRICANYSNPWIFVCLLLIVLLPMTVLTILCTFGKYCECYDKVIRAARLLSLYYWILIWILVTLGMLCPSCCGYNGMYIHFWGFWKYCFGTLLANHWWRASDFSNRQVGIWFAQTFQICPFPNWWLVRVS